MGQNLSQEMHLPPPIKGLEMSTNNMPRYPLENIKAASTEVPEPEKTKKCTRVVNNEGESNSPNSPDSPSGQVTPRRYLPTPTP